MKDEKEKKAINIIIQKIVEMKEKKMTGMIYKGNQEDSLSLI